MEILDIILFYSIIPIIGTLWALLLSRIRHNYFDANGVLAVAACTAANTFTQLFSINDSMSTITQTDSKNDTEI